MEIKNLTVEAGGKKILEGVNLKVGKGEVLALLGPNASGKSTLAKAIAGIPGYSAKEGSIVFKGEPINKVALEKRVKQGIAMVFQNPPALPGVKLSKLLGLISKGGNGYGESHSGLLDREVNVNFSGGEKKISELIQVLSLNPKLLILDEIDSGLDMKKSGEVMETIKGEVKKGMSVLLITHQGEILKQINPDKVAVLVKGKVGCTSEDWKKVLKTIKKNDYAQCKKCKKL
ncbi:MAG: ATP-binding cassette domain-containing protein [Candidatus Pacebacteria bacterium]|nr:ATP-binding cassette domain-containing protein [Candidatus Paceibacterota bacterium]